MDRRKLIAGYDKYYLWDNYKLKNKITNCEFINFGALKSYIVLEREKKWNCLNDEFKKSKRIILISSIGEIIPFLFVFHTHGLLGPQGATLCGTLRTQKMVLRLGGG